MALITAKVRCTLWPVFCSNWGISTPSTSFGAPPVITRMSAKSFLLAHGCGATPRNVSVPANAARGKINAHHRSVTRALSPYAQLSRAAADHSRRLEDARGGLCRLRQYPGQQRDVFLNARPRRHSPRRAAALRQNGNANRRVSAREL